MKTPTTIVWVYGGSAAGKETFIRALTETRPSWLLSQFGWNDHEIIPSKKSIELIAQYKGDPVGEQREELLAEVSQLAKKHPGAIILVKGQDIDLENTRQQRLKVMLPEAEHRIIYLHGEAKEHFGRWQRKSWYRPSYHEGMVQNWLKYQVGLLMPLAKEFGILAFDGGAEGKYAPISFPPEIR